MEKLFQLFRDFTSEPALAKANVWVSAFMVLAICFSAIPLATRRHGGENRALERNTAMAMACWLAWWVILIGVHAAIPNRDYWQTLMIDGVGCVFMLGTAFFILPIPFKYTRREFLAVAAATLGLLTIWPFLLGGQVAGHHPLGWRMFVAAPGIIISVGTFIALGIGASHRFQDHATNIWLLCVSYGLVQIPAYVVVVSEAKDNGYSFVMGMLAIGKVLFLFLYVMIVCGVTYEKTSKAFRSGFSVAAAAIYVCWIAALVSHGGLTKAAAQLAP